MSDDVVGTFAEDSLRATAPPPVTRPPKRYLSANLDLYAFWPVAVIILVILITSFRSSNYFSVTNFKNVLSQMSVYGIVTMGECILLISGGIDLSVGANMAFSSVCTG